MILLQYTQQVDKTLHLYVGGTWFEFQLQFYEHFFNLSGQMLEQNCEMSQNHLLTIHHLPNSFNIIYPLRGRQIQGTRSPWCLKIFTWHLNFLSLIHGFLSPYLQKKYAGS
jgi:hypothetical protein